MDSVLSKDNWVVLWPLIQGHIHEPPHMHAYTLHTQSTYTHHIQNADPCHLFLEASCLISLLGRKNLEASRNGRDSHPLMIPVLGYYAQVTVTSTASLLGGLEWP